jgi:membrane associated rhomboid family serine protease
VTTVFRRSPTVDTLAAFAVVYLLQLASGLLGLAGLFVLGPPVFSAPVTLALSVYAHAGLGHLLSNSLALLLLGFAVERGTSRLRFHAFFLTTGIVAGIAQVVVGGLFSPAPVGVLGASGAIFGLLGYLLAGNSLSGSLLNRFGLGRRAQLALFVLVAAVVTVATASPGVALLAHFTGLLVGLVAGRLRLLRV